MNWLAVNNQSWSNSDTDPDRPVGDRRQTRMEPVVEQIRIERVLGSQERRFGWRLIVSYCNFFRLRVIVKNVLINTTIQPKPFNISNALNRDMLKKIIPFHSFNSFVFFFYLRSQRIITLLFIKLQICKCKITNLQAVFPDRRVWTSKLYRCIAEAKVLAQA
jgi:hypothetical protein